MTASLSESDAAKYAAAWRAAELVEPGMRLGLGTGSTAAWLVRILGARARVEDLRLTCVATSSRTAAAARGVGLQVVDLDEAGWLDLTIDGADEVGPGLTLIKGGGGALLQEKIVATASDRMVAIADAGKDVAALGAFPLPVEVVRFGWQVTRRLVERALSERGFGGCDTALRMAGGAPYVTDEGHYILDLALGRIDDPAGLGIALAAIPGVVETGLFVGICDAALFGHPDGRVTGRDRAGPLKETRAELAGAETLPAEAGA